MGHTRRPAMVGNYDLLISETQTFVTLAEQCSFMTFQSTLQQLSLGVALVPFECVDSFFMMKIIVI